MLVERLSKESGLRSDRLRFFARTASKRYFVFSIPKATGGHRQIAHPARPLKAVQRWLNNNYLRRLPVHDRAMAYRKGVGIRDNALLHAASRYTVRIDFRDFFPNFTILHVFQYLKGQQELLGLSDSDIMFVTQIVCRFEGLTIGAPTSPILTNAMMFQFDAEIARFCEENGLIYSRYADDIFVSASMPNALGNALLKVKEVALAYPFANLKINSRKTAFLSKKYHRRITGLVITPQGLVSLGRDRKREIKSLVHRLIQGILPSDRINYLKGLLSFTSDVDPAFYNALRRKYGEEFEYLLLSRVVPIPTGFAALEKLDPPPESP